MPSLHLFPKRLRLRFDVFAKRLARLREANNFLCAQFGAQKQKRRRWNVCNDDYLCVFVNFWWQWGYCWSPTHTHKYRAIYVYICMYLCVNLVLRATFRFLAMFVRVLHKFSIKIHLKSLQCFLILFYIILLRCCFVMQIWKFPLFRF